MPASALWIILAGLALAAAYMPLVRGGQSRLRSGLKTLPLCLFAAAAYLAGGPAFLMMALGLSALGDLALSRDARVSFFYGVAAIGLARLCYILLFLSASRQALWDAFAVAPLPAAAIVALALSSEIWLTTNSGRFRWVVRAHATLAAALLLAALTVPVAIPGAALLVASDLLLGLSLFRKLLADRWTGPVGLAIWILNIQGQVLILWGILAA